MSSNEDPAPPNPFGENPWLINPRTEIDIDWDRAHYYQRWNAGKDIITIIRTGKIKSTGIEVYIKSYKSKDETEVRKYESEGKIMQMLHGVHPAFLDYYGMFYESITESSETFFILHLVMELCECSLMDDMILRAQSQHNYINDGSYSTIVHNLLEGFIALKRLKIYHQDINLHNIWLSKNRQIKIADFKVSIFKDAKNQYFYEGMQYYMPPEIRFAMDDIRKDPKAQNRIRYKLEKGNVYALGSTFLELYNLKSNWNIIWCTDQNYINTFLDQLQPPQVANMLKGMLTIDPKKRYNFRKALKTFMRFDSECIPDK